MRRINHHVINDSVGVLIRRILSRKKHQDSFQASTNIGKYFEEAQSPVDKREIEKHCVYKVACRICIYICREEESWEI